MKEYKIFFQPTFHDDVTLSLVIENDFGIIYLTGYLKYENRLFLSEEEISADQIKTFNKEICIISPLFIQTQKDGGIDGMNIECFFSDDEENHSNEFSVWSPRGNDYQEHLVFINSVYDLACRIFTDQESVRLLKNLAGYFERRKK